ncbi:BPTI/Kunitz domain-containing protein-like [Liasis olivaceus]
MKAVRGLLLLGLLALLAELPLSVGQNDICRLPKEEGDCTEYQPRWFYNWTAGTCERFNYGGCGGNENNFEIFQLCLSRCTRPERCLLPADPGPCRGYIRRFFYNRVSHKCEQFIYGGCGGNANNFETLEECRFTCEEKPGVCPQPPSDIAPPIVECGSDWECPRQEKCCNLSCRVPA